MLSNKQFFPDKEHMKVTDDYLYCLPTDMQNTGTSIFG